MSFDYLNEAFKKLELLKEETFDTSPNGLASMKSFMDADLEDDSVRVIDPEADRDEDLQDSYIGKVITNCNVCHSNIFENKEDIVIDEDGTVNAEKQCPYCGETMGFTVMGEVTEFVPTEEDDKPKVTVDGEDVPVETPEEEPVEEKLEEEVKSASEKEPKVELEEGKRQYKPHTLKILKMLDEEPLTESKGTTIPEPWNKYLKVDNYEPDEGEYNVGDTIGEYELVAYLVPKRKYEDKFDGWPMLFRNDETLVVGETSHDRVYIWDPADFGIEPLTEAVNNVNVETDDSIVNIQSGEDGKVTVSTEPKEPEVTGEEAIGPVSDETMADIEAANAPEDEPVEDAKSDGEEEPEEDEYEDVDFEEVDEDSFDELGESYLKRVYENVDSFRTCDVSSNEKKLIVEGIIKFKSGTEKKTGFIFEAHSTANGKVRFTGMNKHFSRGSKSFALTGKVENKKLISESLTYNYRAKVGNGKSTRIYGTISK